MSGSVCAFRRGLSCIKTRLLSQKLVNTRALTSTVRCFSVTQQNNMKLVQFEYNEAPGEIRTGYIEGTGVVDLNKADPSIPLLLVDILKSDAMNKVLEVKNRGVDPEPICCLSLKAPITRQDKVLCVGLNYIDHCKEQNITPPEVPMIFSKFASAVIGPNDSVKLRTEVTENVDWEVELVVVIGKEASCIQPKEAYDYILGYTVAQDLSARDWQKEKNGGQVLLGKTMDTFCPIGPWIVTKDELKNPESLDISCAVNNVNKQSSNTSNLIHKIPNIVSRLASVMTLFPGDIILTGTPGGVGCHRKPPQFLKVGDVITSEIKGIGVLTTKVEKYVKPN